MRIILIVFISLLSILSNRLSAQLDDNIKAKLYFTEAEKLFKQGDFKASRSYVEKTEYTLGLKVARTMALKIKIAYNLGEFIKAKELFDDYTNNYMKSASEELNDEVLKLFIDIEDAAEAEEKRQAKAKEAEERRRAEAKEAEERRRAEAKEAEERRKEFIRNSYIIVNGRKLEIAKKDLGSMYWDQAKNACNNLGSGWRLPTKFELMEIGSKYHKYGIVHFQTNDAYWTSSEFGSSAAIAVDFEDFVGSVIRLKKGKANVRAVRDL